MDNTKPISELSYPFAEVEAKWQKIWEERGTYKFHWTPPSPPTEGGGKERPKFYVLTMFSYPSGDKLHMGHWYCYAPTDTFARFKRMQGYEVFEPMGFDAFGLPAENYAIKTGIHPRISTVKNVSFMREQLKRIGAMYDWDYEVNTSAPDYYRWTQWWFLLMYERGLAYQKEALVNWCPQCQTVLANEQVNSDNSCERCGAEVHKKFLRQWFFKITEYNQRLLDGLETIDWPEKTKAMQRYWIGKSEGTEIEFPLDNPLSPPASGEETIRVFTTRADTLFGVTYVVLAPEHELVEVLTTNQQQADVERYVAQAMAATDIERMAADRPKTGVFTGSYCTHPLTEERLPIWVADYVIGSYGTGAVMAVPAHDERDHAFAKQYQLPIKQVIKPKNDEQSTDIKQEAFTDYGVMVNSRDFDGLDSEAGIRAVGRRLEELSLGKPTITWHLRDWTVSRQRYWGAPIPMIHCEKCGVVPVPQEQLPVLLPEDIEEYKPQGKSPLETVDSFVNTTCPKCGGAARRDTDTMDTFVCSSWYFMRYPDARLDNAPFDPKHLNKMLPIEQYVGGPEHAMGHLIYSRFFAKVAKDAGYLNCEEPFSRLVHQGIILNKGERMSKSKGNVVAPEPILDQYGSDTLRCFLMFMGDYTQGGDWSDAGISGIERFVGRIWRLVTAILNGQPADSNEIPRDLDRKLHQTIKYITPALQTFDFHGGMARLMELTNQIYAWVGPELKNVPHSPATLYMSEMLLKLLAPFAPHLCEELWERLGHEQTIFDEAWPVHDEDKAREDQVTVAVQIGGKLRGTIDVEMDASEAKLMEAIRGLDKLQPHLEGKQIVKTIIVPNKIVNLVVR
ncbi:MAG: leucine--tRNA ligase [Calditrichota bacterium]